MTLPKGMVADHWTNRAPIGAPPKFEVTGWHRPPPKKRGHPKPEETQPSGRGIVAVSLFERIAQGREPQQISKNTGPSKRRLRELEAPRKPSRVKHEQGELL